MHYRQSAHARYRCWSNGADTKKLLQLRDEGVAELLVSADLNEVLELSDSLIVLHDHRICAYFPDASKVDEIELGQFMLGIKTMSAEEIGRAIHEP